MINQNIKSKTTKGQLKDSIETYFKTFNNDLIESEQIKSWD